MNWSRPLAALVSSTLFSGLLAILAIAPRAQAPAAAPAAPTAADAIERPFLWRIELPTPSYLFGTIHLTDERVTKLPPVVDDAIAACDALFTEIPMEMEGFLKVANAANLPRGTSLEDVIGAELYARIEAYVASRGQRMAMFDRAQPWAVATQLVMLDQLKQMATKVPLDMQLYDRAKKAKKVVGGLETVAEQIAVFSDLTVEEQKGLLESTLDRLVADAAKGKDPIESLLQLYLRGDEQGIDQELNDFPLGDAALREKLIARLLDDRNLRMVDGIVRRLQEHPQRCQLFAVGAAHYPGRNGILPLLALRGYRVTRMELTASDETNARERAAIDAEIARREAEIEALRTRRARLLPAGSGR